MGYSLEEESQAQRKIFRYWRNKGLDVTSEGFLFLRIDPFIGLQPMTWNYHEHELDANWEFKPQNFEPLLPDLASWTPIRFEHEILEYGEKGFSMVLDDFVWKAVAWYFCRNSSADQSQDVLITSNELYCQMSWSNESVIAVSRQGFNERVFRLPSLWNIDKNVQISELTDRGEKVIGELEVINGSITLSTKANQIITIKNL